MQQTTVVLILSLAIFANALRVSTSGVNLGDQSAEELTFKIRRLEPHEAARGNLYHLYKEHMARLNESVARAERGLQFDGVDLGSMINIGKEVWDIIVKNQPTSVVKVNYGTATPVSTN